MTDEVANGLLAAAKEMRTLMDNLWKSVNWGTTFDLDIGRLNTAPSGLERAIARAEESNRNTAVRAIDLEKTQAECPHCHSRFTLAETETA